MFEKGVICGSYNKKGHTREEFYKLVGYPVGYPLHGKYKPHSAPQIFTTHENSTHDYVNMTVAQGTNAESTSSSSHENDTAMCARMDRLQNQLNQMMLMMQNNKEVTGAHPFNAADHHKRIAHGSLYNGLYIIKQEPAPPTFTIQSITNNNVALWHLWLGHPSFTVLQQIKSLSTSQSCNSHVCNICPMAKQNALPFPISDSHATALFDLIHVDNLRPYRHSTVNK
ncbi:cysteine-rich receptor-like protein kinase 8 [Tanacetum coccineum]